MTTDLTCDLLQKELASISLVKECDVVDSGAIRIATPFTFPDGSNIDLFLIPHPGLFKGYTLSDYGYTAMYLMEIGFDLWQTKKRRQVIADICEQFGVAQDSGQFFISLDEKNMPELGLLMARLAQACTRLVDLSFTQRMQNVSGFTSDVEEFLAVKNLEYEPDPELMGRYGTPIRLDFAVSGRQSRSLIQTFSTANPTTTHVASNEIFRKWFDLKGRPEQFVTVFDAKAEGIKIEDLQRLSDVSLVLSFPNEQDRFAEAISA